MPVLSSPRNQSINLHSKSVDWFLYEGSTGIYWLITKPAIYLSNLSTRKSSIKMVIIGNIEDDYYLTIYFISVIFLP